jgi:hypothetical protein
VWSSQGRLYYWDTEGRQLVEAILDDDPAGDQLELVERRSILASGDTLWRTDVSGFGSSPGLSGYQVATDDERFLMLEPYPLPEFHEHGILVLMNWLDGR